MDLVDRVVKDDSSLACVINNKKNGRTSLIYFLFFIVFSVVHAKSICVHAI